MWWESYVNSPQKNLKNLPRISTWGSEIDALERQVSVQTSVQALDSFFVYIQRRRYDFKQVIGFTWWELYIISPPRISKGSQIATSRSHNWHRWWLSTSPNLGPSAKYLAWVWAKEKRWFQAGSLPYLVTSPPRNSKISQIATSGSDNSRRWWPRYSPNLGPSAKYLFWICAKEKRWFQAGSLPYLVRTKCHQP